MNTIKSGLTAALRLMVMATVLCGVTFFAQAGSHSPADASTDSCDARNRELIKLVAEQEKRISILEQERRRLNGIIEKIRVDAGDTHYRPTGKR
jgi:TolA-binding protein